MNTVSDFPLRIPPARALLITAKFLGLQLLLYLLLKGGETVWSMVRPLSAGADFLNHPLALIVINTTAALIVAQWELRRLELPWRAIWIWRVRPVVLFAPFLTLIVGLGILINEANGWIELFLPAPNWLGDAFEQLDDLSAHPISGPVTTILMAAFTEELIFRGLILRGLLAVCRPGAAVVISAVLFMAMHLNPWQFPIALATGLALGWAFVRTRSLGLCFAGHALNNGISLLASGLPFEIGGFNADSRPEDPGYQPLWFNFVGLALFVIGAILFHRLAPRPVWTLVVPPPVGTGGPPVRKDERECAFLDGRAPHPCPPIIDPPILAVSADAKSLGAGPNLGDVDSQMSADLVQLATALAQRARAASLVLAPAPTAKKDAALLELARLIDTSQSLLIAANQRDLASAEAAALAPAARDRLTVDAPRLTQLAQSVRAVAALPDPVGTVLEEFTRPNGLHIRKLRVPIGVIGIIYEARPNVTIDCAILCLKSGNACILRGGKECFHTNVALAALVSQALVAAGLPADAVQLVPTTDRAALTTLLKLDTLIHCIIPRGGESLIRFVAANSTIPVIKHYKGVCFVYVDAAADLAMGESITVNAKVQRPSVCNAAEQLLVHRSVAGTFLPAVARALVARKVELRCDAAAAAILARAEVSTTPATEADFSTEFLDYVIAIRVVDSLDIAIATINRDSSNHSDAIVTADAGAAHRFFAEVDSATVYWNASTRFTDGFEFGYGAEIGISTDRLHARGPMGLRELCTHKFVIEGTGQIRT